MIDFPPGTTVGQTYLASNGVTYMWTGAIWVATAGGTSPGGDFMATNSANISLGASTYDALTLNTVYSGNSGSWYSTSTGRYTPPAGRYYISVGFSSTNGTSVFQTRCALYKNGVAVGTNTVSPGSIVSVEAVGNWGNPTYEAIVDANGTDYFQMVGYGSPASTVIQQQTAWFLAYPVSGIKGPQGDPGQLGFRLLQRTVVSSAVPTVDITSIASDINDLKFTFDLVPVTNAVYLRLQIYDGTATIIAGATSYGNMGSAVASTQAFGSAPIANAYAAAAVDLSYGSAGYFISNFAGFGIQGSGTIPNIKAATRTKTVQFNTTYLADGAISYRSYVGGGMVNNTIALTGIRLFFHSGNIASGTFSVWGSP